MNIIAIIPARYNSSRFAGKPLASICGKPMIWWVYKRISTIKEIKKVIVATDDDRIFNYCSSANMYVEMTSNTCSTSTERAYEIAQRNKADIYIVINGDEPLIDPETVKRIIPKSIPNNEIFVSNLYTKINIPSEVVDFTNIKVVLDDKNNAMFMSRSPIPYPKSSLNYDYFKHVGVLAYNFNALDFFAKTKRGMYESIEDVNEIRFLEHGIKIKMVYSNSETLSVDTPKDLEKVIEIIKERGLDAQD